MESAFPKPAFSRKTLNLKADFFLKIFLHYFDLHVTLFGRTTWHILTCLTMDIYP